MFCTTHPLVEVFGFPVTADSDIAKRHRNNRLCPFNNKVPNCTKDKANNPLGVCSIAHENNAVITCPIRFREDWSIAVDAASFFFPENTVWSSLVEVRINDAAHRSAGNIDVVLVAYDQNGIILDFGALEIQAVYISGNVREPFEFYMQNPSINAKMDWTKKEGYPRPDYLSSSRKRLAPQLLFKGGILHSWGKKTAVALNKTFFASLPKLKRVPKEDADLAWLVYDLQLCELKGEQHLKLVKIDEVFSKFKPSLRSITRPQPGNVNDFIRRLQLRLSAELKHPPTNSTITAAF